METVSAAAFTNIDLARLKAASDLHSSDWLHAAPIAPVGLKLTDEEIQIAGGYLDLFVCKFTEAWSQSMLPLHLCLR